MLMIIINNEITPQKCGLVWRWSDQVMIVCTEKGYLATVTWPSGVSEPKQPSLNGESAIPALVWLCVILIALLTWTINLIDVVTVGGMALVPSWGKTCLTGDAKHCARPPSSASRWRGCFVWRIFFCQNAFVCRNAEDWRWRSTV